MADNEPRLFLPSLPLNACLNLFLSQPHGEVNFTPLGHPPPQFSGSKLVSPPTPHHLLCPAPRPQPSAFPFLPFSQQLFPGLFSLLFPQGHVGMLCPPA